MAVNKGCILNHVTLYKGLRDRNAYHEIISLFTRCREQQFVQPLPNTSDLTCYAQQERMVPAARLASLGRKASRAHGEEQHSSSSPTYIAVVGPEMCIAGPQDKLKRLPPKEMQR